MSDTPNSAISDTPNPPMPAAPNTALPDAATDDDARTALLNVGDSRLIQLEHAASNDAAKDITIHASA
jgi:multidrug resistance protein MdtO